MEYVNFQGDRVALDPSLHAKPKRPREQPESFHNGWRVVGIPPGALDEAREGNARVAAMASRAGGKPTPPFDESKWLMNAKRRPVRSKPYEVPQAAEQCKSMAEKAGWLRVEIVELKRETA